MHPEELRGLLRMLKANRVGSVLSSLFAPAAQLAAPKAMCALQRSAAETPPGTLVPGLFDLFPYLQNRDQKNTGVLGQ